jgi:pilus assembly protein FimV
MMGSLRRQTGDASLSIELFNRAVAAARTKDERCESNYELAMALLQLGRDDEAKHALELVEPGYRDREARLSELA